MGEPNQKQSESQVENILQDMALEEQVELLSKLLKVRKMSEGMQDFNRQRKTDARRERYRLNAHHREHVLELKRNRCNWRYEHDSAYCERVKAAARARAITASQRDDTDRKLRAELQEYISRS